MHENTGDAEKFWEDLYAGRGARPADASPNAVLTAVLTDPDLGLSVGNALDLGCAEGADTVWLAQNGWDVLGVDISATALERTRARAEHAGVSEQIHTERHDLATSFPDGRFDLVSAHYLQTPLRFPRTEILQKAAAAVRPGGLLLIVDHASTAPWSWDRGKNIIFPTPQETLNLLDLDPLNWTAHRVEAANREATGPDGQSATVTDNVIALRRTRLV